MSPRLAIVGFVVVAIAHVEGFVLPFQDRSNRTSRGLFSTRPARRGPHGTTPFSHDDEGELVDVEFRVIS